MDFMWFQQLIVGYVIKHGLDKSFKFLSKIDPLVMSISISIDRTRLDLQIETVDYLLRSAFGKDKKLINLIKANYKTNPKIVISELSQSLLSCGADFGEDTESKINEIVVKFVSCFSEELPKVEKVPSSISQTTEATLRRTQSNGEIINKIWAKIEEKDKVLDSVDNQFKKNASSGMSVAVAKDSSPELDNSKYKKDIQEAKVLLDKERFVAAKTIYEKLLEEFKTDPHVPVVAKFKVHNNLGACQAALGNVGDAAKNFIIAFDIIGNTSIIACKNRALASMFEGKPLEGIPFIDAAIALDQDNNDCINLKAILLMRAGQLDQAIELYSDRGVK